MADDKDPESDGGAADALSIAHLLDAERDVEADLDAARKAAAELTARAYEKAQALDREAGERIKKLGRECTEANERRVAEILAQAERIEERPIKTTVLKEAVREAAQKLAAQLTGGD